MNENLSGDQFAGLTATDRLHMARLNDTMHRELGRGLGQITGERGDGVERLQAMKPLEEAAYDERNGWAAEKMDDRRKLGNGDFRRKWGYSKLDIGDNLAAPPVNRLKPPR